MKKRGYSVTALLLSFVMALSVTAGSFSVPAFAEELATVESVETVDTVEESEAIEEAVGVEEAALDVEENEEAFVNEQASESMIGLFYLWEEEIPEGWITYKSNYVEIPYEEGLSLLDLIYANFTGDLSCISGWYQEIECDGEMIDVPVTADMMAEEDLYYCVKPYYNKVDVQFSFFPYEEGGVDYFFVTVAVDENTTLYDIIALAPEEISQDSRFVKWRVSSPYNLSKINTAREINIDACYGVQPIDVHFYYYDTNGNIKESIQTYTYDSDVESEDAVLDKVVIPEDAMEGTTYTPGGYNVDFERTRIEVCADGCNVVIAYVVNYDDSYENYNFYKAGKLVKLPLKYDGYSLDGWHYGYYDENGEWVTGYSTGIVILPDLEGITEFYLFPCYAMQEEKNLYLNIFWEECVGDNSFETCHEEVVVESVVGEKLLDVINRSFTTEIPDFDGWYIESYYDDYNYNIIPITEETVITEDDYWLNITPYYNKTMVKFVYYNSEGEYKAEYVDCDVDENTTFGDLWEFAPSEAAEDPEFTGWRSWGFKYGDKVNTARSLWAEAAYGVREATLYFAYEDQNGELKLSTQYVTYDSLEYGTYNMDELVVIPDDAKEGTVVSGNTIFSGDPDILYSRAKGLDAALVYLEGCRSVELLGVFRVGDTIELPDTFAGNNVDYWYYTGWDEDEVLEENVGFSFTVPEEEDYGWLWYLFAQCPEADTRSITFSWNELVDEENGCFDYHIFNVDVEAEADDKILDVIEEVFTEDTTDISGWFYWEWNEETESTEAIPVTEDTVFGDRMYYYFVPGYSRIYVEYVYPKDGYGQITGVVVDVDENTTLEDLYETAPEEAKENQEIKGWVLNSYEPVEQINLECAVHFTADVGVISESIILVYRGKDGKLKESEQVVTYDSARTTESEIIDMLVLPDDAEEGTELPVADYPDKVFGYQGGSLVYTLGDINPVYVVAVWSGEGSWDEIGVSEAGETFSLPKEYNGRKIIGWSYKYYDADNECVFEECSFDIVIPEADMTVWVYPVFEEEIPEVKNGIYEEDGGLYYYEDDQRVYAGLIQIGDDFYYVQGGGVVSTGNYYITQGNGIMDKGHAQFGPDGKMILNGIIKIRGEYYYYEDSRPVENLGLICWNQYHYYIGEGGKAATGTVEVVKANGIVNEGLHEFGKDGKMVLDGIIMINGKLRYYVGGVMRSQAGMIKIGDDMYYVGASAEVATGKRSVGSRHNGLVAPGMHYFDEETGKFIY